MAEYTLIPRAPFADLTFASAALRGVAIVDRDGLGLATVLARKGQGLALAQRVREHFGIELPRGPRRAAAGDIAFARTGPDAWLATGEGGGNTFALRLKEAIGDLAAVSDQSSGYAILRLTGPKVRDTLAKMLPIDLHERAFAAGDVAATNASHVGVTLWRLDNAADGSPVFEITLFRSFVGSFWHTLASSAAEFGLVVASLSRG
jgi:heterotetrameric sarcosine oxidase gamma subunit